MTAANGLELAKQGNPQAIAALMNQTLQSKGITVSATVLSNCLTVVAEADTLPEKDSLLDFIRQGILNLKPQAIDRVIVQGKVKGEKHPGWRENVELPAKSTAAMNGARPISVVSTSQPGKDTAMTQWTLKVRESANTILLAGILLATLGGGWNAHRVEPKLWEYKITGVEDLAFDTTMQRLGAEGWEMTSARRAVSGEGESSRGLYEVIFRRQITQSKAEQNLKNINLWSMQSVGKSLVSTINLHQQLHHIESSSFSASLAGLDASLNSDTENYVASVSLESPDKAIGVAIAKKDELRSYIGAVVVVNGSTQSIICESNQPSRTAPASPTLNGAELQCADGSSKAD